MNDWLWFVLSTIVLLAAVRQLQHAWFLHQVRKRRREDVRARLHLVVFNGKDAA